MTYDGKKNNCVQCAGLPEGEVILGHDHSEEHAQRPIISEDTIRIAHRIAAERDAGFKQGVAICLTKIRELAETYRRQGESHLIAQSVALNKIGALNGAEIVINDLVYKLEHAGFISGDANTQNEIK